MDVQCERCKTEYEFDDALVSGRGTTVRCTNCGHQFKVRKAEASEPGADRWMVRTASGQDLTFLTLRELQRAILAKQVGRGDLLRRGNAPPRTLGTIAELEPFFEGRASSRPPPPGASAPPVPRIAQPSIPRMNDALPEFPKRTASWGIPPEVQAPPVPAPRLKVDTLRPTGGSAAAPPPPPPTPVPSQVSFTPPMPQVSGTPSVSFGPGPGASAFARPAPSVPDDDPVTMRRGTHGPPPAPPQRFDGASPMPPPTVPVRRQSSYGDEEMPDMRRSLPSAAREDYDPLSGRRRVGGWIVAVVLLMSVGVVGWVVAKPYLAPKAPTAPVATLDPRAQGFVADGERALADGRLDAAQEAFDKASALAEHDPRVLVDQARVAAAKADVPWLKLRLLPPDAKEEARAAKADLDDRVAQARHAADAATAVAPDDPTALRVRIDALRLAGDRDAARRDVSKIASQASQPETAYVLAALDLAEPDPLWTTVIDRLRAAAAGEGNAGRARAALVYALAESGDVASAKGELAKLDALARPYPLLPNLHAFVDHLKPRLDGGIAANVPHVDVSALPQQPSPGGAGAAGGAAGGGGGGGGDDTAIPGETGGAMKAAQAAIHKGDWNRARTIYDAIVSRNPGDSEALSGLGDCARAQGDLQGALAAYRRALAVNPSYLPALLGVADTQWATGDRAGALKTYKDIVDRFPEGTYPSYVKSRTEAAAAPTATTIIVTPTATAAASGGAPPAPKSAPAPAAAPTDGL